MKCYIFVILLFISFFDINAKREEKSNAFKIIMRYLEYTNNTSLKTPNAIRKLTNLLSTTSADKIHFDILKYFKLEDQKIFDILLLNYNQQIRECNDSEFVLIPMDYIPNEKIESFNVSTSISYKYVKDNEMCVYIFSNEKIYSYPKIFIYYNNFLVKSFVFKSNILECIDYDTDDKFPLLLREKEKLSGKKLDSEIIQIIMEEPRNSCSVFHQVEQKIETSTVNFEYKILSGLVYLYLSYLSLLILKSIIISSFPVLDYINKKNVLIVYHNTEEEGSTGETNPLVMVE